MKTALAILGLTISASPLVNEDVLEPSVENEVEHALAVAPSNEVALAEAALAAPEYSPPLAALGVTGSVTRTALAVKLVSEQRADGRWLAGTNDVTAAAAGALIWCLR